MSEEEKSNLIDFLRYKIEVVERCGLEHLPIYSVYKIALAALTAPTVSLAELVSGDTKRMEWLVSKVVNVRQPLPYGSRDIFWSQQSSEDCDENYTTDLRDQIDAILRNIEALNEAKS